VLSSTHEFKKCWKPAGFRENRAGPGWCLVVLMDSKNVGNRPVFLVHRPAACNSKNSNFENSKTKKPGETVGLPFYIHQILVFEF
jgi:hypothetical protein